MIENTRKNFSNGIIGFFLNISDNLDFLEDDTFFLLDDLDFPPNPIVLPNKLDDLDFPPNPVLPPNLFDKDHTFLSFSYPTHQMNLKKIAWILFTLYNLENVMGE